MVSYTTQELFFPSAHEFEDVTHLGLTCFIKINFFLCCWVKHVALPLISETTAPVEHKLVVYEWCSDFFVEHLCKWAYWLRAEADLFIGCISMLIDLYCLWSIGAFGCRPMVIEFCFSVRGKHQLHKKSVSGCHEVSPAVPFIPALYRVCLLQSVLSSLCCPPHSFFCLVVFAPRCVLL